MKAIVMTLTLLCIVCFGSNAKTQNEESNLSNQANYRIENASAEEFDIVYSTTSNKIHIEMKKEKSHTFYIVRNKSVEVMYVNGVKGFGLRKISNKWKTMPMNENEMIIDEFRKQSKLSDKKNTDQECLQLIADYFPDVVTKI